jgi:hypothetical protein
MTLLHALDVSNYQPRDLTDLIHRYDISHVIVRLWLPGERPDPGWAIDQLQSAVGNGCSVSGYWWGYESWVPEQNVEDALTLWQRANVGPLPCLWPDIEPYADEGCPDAMWTERACRATEERGVRSGCYIGDWVIESFWGGHVPATLRARPAWIANYNGRADLEGVSRYWEPSLVLGHQYSGDPVDLSVMDEDITMVEGQIVNAPASYEWLQSSLGYASYDVANDLDGEADRRGGPRPEQIHAIASVLRTLAP